MSALRILQIFGEPFSNGGQESYIMNMYRHIDRERVQFDFFTPFQIENPALKEEIERLGGSIYADGRPFGENNNRHFRQGVTDFLEEHPYAIVHIHSGSTYALMVGAKVARRCGARRVIVHSHCGGFVNLKYRVVRMLSYAPLLKHPTDYFACSHLAAKWKFPAPVINQNRYTVLKNAVDTHTFYYDPALREQTRNEFGLQDALVVGHIGRFATQKNHKYLLEIFSALSKKNPRAHLVLVGEGELQEEMIAYADQLGLRERVSFLGIRRDINALLNLFDVFLLPSFFEGLPVVGVEAQATGLPVVTSTAVTPELPIEDLATYVPLSDSPETWADTVIEHATLPRRNTTEEMIACGYDVQVAAAELQRRYEEMK